MGEEQDTGLMYLCFPLRMIKLLKSFNIKPILIFDGRPHEAKTNVEKERSAGKDKNQLIAKQCAKEGKAVDAKKYYTRSLHVKEKQIMLF
jgi:exonuclease-1